MSNIYQPLNTYTVEEAKEIMCPIMQHSEINQHNGELMFGYDNCRAPDCHGWMWVKGSANFNTPEKTFGYCGCVQERR